MVSTRISNVYKALNTKQKGVGNIIVPPPFPKYQFKSQAYLSVDLL